MIADFLSEIQPFTFDYVKQFGDAVEWDTTFSISKCQVKSNMAMFPLNESWVIKAKLDHAGQTLDVN